MLLQQGAFGIKNNTISLVVDLVILFLIVMWLALVYWTYADARRRILDPMLVGCATAASLFPFVGTVVYMILRPPEYLEVLEWQWEQAIRLWRDLGSFALEHGVQKICFELHPLNLAYNVPTLLRLREAVGPVIGANFDPSHLMWQGMDIPACLKALGPAVFHVHMKDTRIDPQALALAGVLDTTAPRSIALRRVSASP